MKRLTYAIIAISITLNILFAVRTYFVSGASFPFLSPRIFVQNPNDTIINFTDLRTQLRSFVETQKDFHAGVYFEYLPSGVSIGVNEKENFISASLIKVPFIMGIYKLMEEGALREDTVITLKKEDLDPHFGNLWKQGEGARLTVREAIRLTLAESDNTAALALDHFAKDDPIREVYNTLDIPIDWSGNQPAVSPKNYSSIFRCLYLSCLLSYKSSQDILHQLTQTIFTDGLPAGVPKGVPFAHKIGMYDSPTSGKRVRLDCGIAYPPKRPYILCVLGEAEKGNEYLITDFTRQVSGLIYRYVANAEAR